MPWEPIDKNMLCLGYWVKGVRERDNVIVQVAAVNEDGILTTDGQAFLYEDLTGIEVTGDWLVAARMETIKTEETAAEFGAYEKSGFPFTFLLHEYVTIVYRKEIIASLRFVHELQHFYAGIKQRTLEISTPENLP